MYTDKGHAVTISIHGRKYELLFTDSADSSNATTKKYVMALYEKSLVEFVRNLEQTYMPKQSDVMDSS